MNKSDLRERGKFHRTRGELNKVQRFNRHGGECTLFALGFEISGGTAGSHFLSFGQRGDF